VSCHLDLLLDLRVSALLPAIRNLGALLGQPNRCKPNEIGGEQCELFLKLQGGLGAHFQVMDFKDLLAFPVCRFNGLAGIVVVEPGRQVMNDRVSAKEQHAGQLERLAHPKALNAELQGVGKVCQAHALPGDHLGVLAYSLPGRWLH
jgi:hypothetical protein